MNGTFSHGLNKTTKVIQKGPLLGAPVYPVGKESALMVSTVVFGVWTQVILIAGDHSFA